MPAGGHLSKKSCASNICRKRLLRNARDGTRLAAPFLMWGVLVVVIYAVSYVELLSEGELLVSSSNSIAWP